MAGTLGACSQVFCHPISCMSVRSYRQRYVRNSPVRITTTTTPPPPHHHTTHHTHTHTLEGHSLKLWMGTPFRQLLSRHHADGNHHRMFSGENLKIHHIYVVVHFPCRGAEAVSHGPDCTSVFDDPVVLVVRVHRCRRGEDSRAPTVALGEKLVMLGPLRVWALLGEASRR